MQIERATRNRDLLMSAMSTSNRLQCASPDGAFYLFFRVEGEHDTESLARRMVDEIALGVAPGTAFGPGGHEFLRLCFARDPNHIAEVASRLSDWSATKM
jgi:aspartate/methionine/tyrosine aminotransferase